MKPPLFIQSVFGILGGIGPHPDDVAHMKRTADRLFGDQYRWSVLGAGRNQLPIASMSAAMGGNVRVGLEDSLWLGPGKLAESNAAQVRAVRGDHRGDGARGCVARRDARAILARSRAAPRSRVHRTRCIRPDRRRARAPSTIRATRASERLGRELLAEHLDQQRKRERRRPLAGLVSADARGCRDAARARSRCAAPRGLSLQHLAHRLPQQRVAGIVLGEPTS